MNGAVMKNRVQEQSLKNKIAEASGLPKDVVMGQPVVTVLGRMELNIENYRGIIEYTDALIRVQTKAGQIRITGKNLSVDYYTNDDMKLTGRIEAIEYQQ
ncbi:MAG: sporulation protein YqfC [Dorea sp.]|nr:sporulation protein YqfC [Dorea sp.]